MKILLKKTILLVTDQIALRIGPKGFLPLLILYFYTNKCIQLRKEKDFMKFSRSLEKKQYCTKQMR